MKDKTVMIRVKKELRNKLKVKAAKKEISISQLLDELLKDIEWK